MKITIKQRLTFQVAASIAAMAVGGLIALVALSLSNSAMKSVYEDRVVPSAQLGNIGLEQERRRNRLENAMTDASADNVRRRLEQIEASRKVIEENWKAYVGTYLTAEEKVLAEKYRIAADRWESEGVKPMLAAIAAKDFKAGMAINHDAQPRLMGEVRKTLDELVKLQGEVARQEVDAAVARARWFGALILASLLACAVFFSWFGFRTTKAITLPLGRIRAVFDAFGRRDFTSRIEVHAEDELGQVMAALGQTQKSLQDADVKAADYEGQIKAINKSQAVIEFTPDGRILSANDIFLSFMGYSANEVVGQHHSQFVDAKQRSGSDYASFWERLGRGEYQSGQFSRVTRGGRTVWIQASYNPIIDPNGKVMKVVKYATDVTDRVLAARQLEQAVTETGVVVEAAKQGDLTQRISMQGKDGAIGELCGGVNQLVESMAEVVGQIKQSTIEINTASNEIASGNTDLSQRTEEQASNLEETASSMEELTSTVKQNADNARQANQLAASASEIAVRGGEVVGQVVSTMGEINDASKKIADIISVIDGIAFQTNILALNAAVEAARAGEQGRGFAVVASEVRNLAQRSAAAAKEIKELITDSVGKVESGAKLVDQAGDTMNEVVSSVRRVTDIMAEITAASQEQSLGIEHVNKAITQMDEVTQQNAALVEEAAAAAESLAEQAKVLEEAVRRFRVDEHEVAGRAVAATPPAHGFTERRGPNRATNVTRPAFNAHKSGKAGGARSAATGKAADRVGAKTGTADSDWEEF